MDFVENDHAEGKDEGGEDDGVAEGRPAEFAHAEHAELERFHDAGERICLHEHFEARVLDGTERVNYGGCVHPKLHNEGEQECEVAVFGGKAAEQYTKAEGERGNQCDKYGREQCVQIRVHGSVGENQVVCKHQEK